MTSVVDPFTQSVLSCQCIWIDVLPLISLSLPSYQSPETAQPDTNLLGAKPHTFLSPNPRSSTSRILFLDYDGTLSQGYGRESHSNKVLPPSEEVIALLRALAADPCNKVGLIQHSQLFPVSTSTCSLSLLPVVLCLYFQLLILGSLFGTDLARHVSCTSPSLHRSNQQGRASYEAGACLQQSSC